MHQCEAVSDAHETLPAQANKPVIGIVQDTLAGIRLMTKRDTFIEKDVFMNMLVRCRSITPSCLLSLSESSSCSMVTSVVCDVQMWLDEWDGKVPTPVILKPRPLWSGKQIINMFLPRVNLVRKASWYNDKEAVDLSPTDSQVPAQRQQCF